MHASAAMRTCTLLAQIAQVAHGVIFVFRSNSSETWLLGGTT
jgi:hypothetical protein